MPRDYERDMETFERKYEAWRDSEYEKYREKQNKYCVSHAKEIELAGSKMLVASCEASC